MYQNGVGVEQDVGEAIRLYKLAADQGDDDARCSLAHAMEFKQFVRTYSPSLPHYVAIAHAVADWHLRRRRHVQALAPHPLKTHCCSVPAVAIASVEVTHAARLRVCTSGWASLISIRVAQCTVASCLGNGRVVCRWACMIAARVLGRRCVTVKVMKSSKRHVSRAFHRVALCRVMRFTDCRERWHWPTPMVMRSVAAIARAPSLSSTSLTHAPQHQFMDYAGYRFRTLQHHTRTGAARWDGRTARALPFAYEICDNDDDARHACKSCTWQADGLVLSDGSLYCTASQACAAGKALLPPPPASAALPSHGCQASAGAAGAC